MSLCAVTWWKLMGHLFCSYQLLNSLLVLSCLWTISIVGPESCPEAECLFCTFRCPSDYENQEGSFRGEHTSCERVSAWCVCPACLMAVLVICSNGSELAHGVANIFTAIFNSDFSDCWKNFGFCGLGNFAYCWITELLNKWKFT